MDYKDVLGQDLAVGDIILVASGKGQPTTQAIARITALKIVNRYEPVWMPLGSPVPAHIDPDTVDNHAPRPDLNYPGHTVYWDHIDLPSVQFLCMIQDWQWPNPLKWNNRKQSTEELKRIVKIDSTMIQRDDIKEMLK